MKKIISHKPGVALNIVCLGLLVGQGLAIIFLVGYIGWVFSLLFFGFAIFPVIALIRPERNYLELGNGIMRWRYFQHGNMIDNAAVVLRDLRHVQVVRHQPETKKAATEINLLTTDGQVFKMPSYLKLHNHEQDVIQTIKKACPQVVVEIKEADAA